MKRRISCGPFLKSGSIAEFDSQITDLPEERANNFNITFEQAKIVELSPDVNLRSSSKENKTKLENYKSGKCP